LSNISVRPRINLPSREKIEQDSKSEAKSKLEPIQEVEVMAQCEKERRVGGRSANKLSRSERAIVFLQKASEREHNLSSEMNLSEDQEVESTVQLENTATECWNKTRNLKIVASTLLVASSSVHQLIPTSKKSTQYFGVRVVLSALISERIALTHEDQETFWKNWNA